MAIDYHICSLDGEECNTEDCNTCEKSINERERKRQLTDLSYMADRTQGTQD